MFKIRSFVGLLLIGLAVQAFAQGVMPPPSEKEVDKSEVIRWGNKVVVTGDGIQSAEDAAFIASMTPPEDDSDCCFITVFGMKSCPACKKLLADFQNPNLPLAAWVAPPPGKTKPWAHFNYYVYEDPFQKDRFKNYEVGNGPFPIMVIQPPRNGKYGKPEWVVWRFEAKDLQDPVKLSENISIVWDAYLKKLARNGWVPPINANSQTLKKLIPQTYASPHAIGTSQDIPAANPYAFGQTKKNEQTTPAGSSPPSLIEQAKAWGGPWGPDPPAPQPFNPQFPNVQPTAPPVQPQLQPAGGDAFSLTKIVSYAMILLAGLKVYEAVATQYGWNTGPTKLLRELLEQLTKQNSLVAEQTNIMAATPPSSTLATPPAGWLLNSEGQLVQEPKPKK